MEQILTQIVVPVNQEIYLKDPLSSDLGKRIIQEGTELIETLGMEGFNFKKLSEKVGSTEAAIYRYFENKHKLLLYLTNWYWGWLEHNLVFVTANLLDPKDKMRVAIQLLVEGPVYKQNIYIDIQKLRVLVTEESYKAFLTKEIDAENSNGLFTQFYRLTDRIAQIIKEINPKYSYPKTLVTTLVESTLLHAFFLRHMPKMTESGLKADQKLGFYFDLVFKTLKDE
ncbi:DNA-binding transcriptional regulator, AcrR family [Cyclobacterium xiamenense]|uniref:DNA-binding transcriptional regulator, AcrR family n=1 Tax=Cyclobacterium xiamenense TaxID=1297121 RepID=A0A1H6YZ56_9BACT|nr:TetR/AcrR family transcriptional regulator [Cyclobacterium xiamenense]SEJ46491.1 DNA-binding transcriptional regulator, AcrR family [Cyclobacterium xiamenense]